MKVIFVSLILVIGAFSAKFDQEAMNTLWSSWKVQYGKVYENEETDFMRFQIFQDNYQRIAAWNAAGNTATLAINKFADLTNEEFAALYTGAFPAPKDVKLENTVSFEGVDVPASWDWRQKGAVTPVKDQGQCGSCWAFSTIATLEGLNKIKGKSLTSFSEQQVVDCDTTCYGCNGGMPYKAFQYVAAYGLETEAQYPYAGVTESCQYSSSQAQKNINSGYSFVTPGNSTQLKAAISQQPVSVLVEADQDVFQFYNSGVITSGCGVNVDHAVTAVGYGSYSGQDAFFVKNSWGSDWGVDGYIYISTSTQYNTGAGACGVLVEPQYPKA